MVELLCIFCCQHHWDSTPGHLAPRSSRASLCVRRAHSTRKRGGSLRFAASLPRKLNTLSSLSRSMNRNTHPSDIHGPPCASVGVLMLISQDTIQFRGSSTKLDDNIFSDAMGFSFGCLEGLIHRSQQPPTSSSIYYPCRCESITKARFAVDLEDGFLNMRT